MAKTQRDTESNENGATLGFEAILWQTADKLRNNLDAAEYKHVVLGLIFLKYISDTFEERYTLLLKESANPHSEFYVEDETGRSELAEDRDEYLAENIFYVPQKARWPYLQANAKQPEIGTLIDKAMIAIEQENPSLKGVLPKDYARPVLDKQRLGELIDLISTIGLGEEGIAQRIYWGGSTNTSSHNSLVPRAKGAVSSTPLAVLCGCSLRCSHPTKGGFTTRAAVLAVCLSRVKSLLKRTADSATISPSSGRSRTRPRDNWH
jgi:hypothetical protein